MTDGTSAGELTTVRLSTEGADLLSLAGAGDTNLAELQKLFPVRVTPRGEAIVIAGAAEAVEKAVVVATRMAGNWSVAEDSLNSTSTAGLCGSRISGEETIWGT